MARQLVMGKTAIPTLSTPQLTTSVNAFDNAQQGFNSVTQRLQEMTEQENTYRTNEAIANALGMNLDRRIDPTQIQTAQHTQQTQANTNRQFDQNYDLGRENILGQQLGNANKALEVVETAFDVGTQAQTYSEESRIRLSELDLLKLQIENEMASGRMAKAEYDRGMKEIQREQDEIDLVTKTDDAIYADADNIFNQGQSTRDNIRRDRKELALIDLEEVFSNGAFSDEEKEAMRVQISANLDEEMQVIELDNRGQAQARAAANFFANPSRLRAAGGADAVQRRSDFGPAFSAALNQAAEVNAATDARNTAQREGFTQGRDLAKNGNVTQAIIDDRGEISFGEAVQKIPREGQLRATILGILKLKPDTEIDATDLHTLAVNSGQNMSILTRAVAGTEKLDWTAIHQAAKDLTTSVINEANDPGTAESFGTTADLAASVARQLADARDRTKKATKTVSEGGEATAQTEPTPSNTGNPDVDNFVDSINAATSKFIDLTNKYPGIVKSDPARTVEGVSPQDIINHDKYKAVEKLHRSITTGKGILGIRDLKLDDRESKLAIFNKKMEELRLSLEVQAEKESDVQKNKQTSASVTAAIAAAAAQQGNN